MWTTQLTASVRGDKVWRRLRETINRRGDIAKSSVNHTEKRGEAWLCLSHLDISVRGFSIVMIGTETSFTRQGFAKLLGTSTCTPLLGPPGHIISTFKMEAV